MEKGGLIFQINESDKTAQVISVGTAIGDITIPTYIQNGENEYTVISIAESAFYNISRITSIKFAPDSKIETFCEAAFFNATFESISIPSSLTKIEKECFSRCEISGNIEIPKNSKLQIIDDYAFYNSTISSIWIPPQVTKIGFKAFCKCKNLKHVGFAKNIKLQSIGSFVFSESSIESITIPSNICEFEYNWCHCTYKLKRFNIIKNSKENVYFSIEKILYGKSDPETDVFDTILYADRDIEKVIIQPHIKRIASSAFHGCEKLKKIQICGNSQLEVIEDNAFQGCQNIERILLPKSLKKIGGFAFSYCNNLKRIDIPQNSKLETIDDHAFYRSTIECFYIPPSVSNIGQKIFFECDHLRIIEIDEESKFFKMKNNQKFGGKNAILMN